MVCRMRVLRPLVGSVEMFDKPFGQQTLQIAEKDDVVLAVKVNPTAVAVLGMVTLHLTCCLAVENLIE